MNIQGMTEITNSEDVIDSRSIIARIAYLQAAWAESTGDDPSDYTLSEDDWSVGLGTDEAHELVMLKALADEASVAPDWQYGEALIRDSYFGDYARELANDIEAIPADGSWPTSYIDWEAAADALKVDYFEVDFDGVTYWVRS